MFSRNYIDWSKDPKEEQSMAESLQLLQTEVHNFALLPSIFENCKFSQIKGPPPTRFCMKKKVKNEFYSLLEVIIL